VLRGLRTSEIPRPVTVIPIWAQAREAARLVGHDRLLRALAVAQALAALSAGATSGLLVVLAARRLHTSGGGYGLLLAAIAAGALTGPLLLAQLPGHFARRPTVVFAAFGLRGAVDWVLATVTALPAALAALMCYGIGTSTGNVAFSTVIQSHVADKLRGRIFSAFDLIWQAMRLASLLAGGLLADTIGIRAVYYLGGALMAAAALAGWTSAGSPIPAPRTC
jgi:MFS family permease